MPRQGPPPKNKTYAPWNKERRFEGAAGKVLYDNWKVADAAAEFGVSRPRLQEKVKAARERLDARVAQAKAEQLAGTVLEAASGPLGLNERRRIGTFAEFDARYFSNWMCPDCGVHHATEPFQQEISDACQSAEPRVLINIPPFHAKSTIVTVKDTVYDIARNPNIRELVISKSLPFARTFLHSIDQILTNTDLYGDGPNLIDDWGPFKPEGANSVWNKDQIYCAGRTSAEKDPTVQVLGVGGQVYGRRADKIKADDVATLSNQINPDQVLRMLEWFDKEVLSRVGKRGKVVWVGTRVHAGDIYSHIKDRPGYKILRYSCILDDTNEEVLWPEHFPYSHALILRSEMKPADWQLIYQNVDTPGEGASFTQDMIDACKDTSRTLGHYDSHWRLVAGLDPAGGNKKSGFTAMFLLGVDLLTGKRYIVDVVNIRSMRAPEMKQQILDWSSQYPIFEWRVEGNGLQNQLIQYDTEIIKALALMGTRVTPHNTHNNKWDPQFGVESMAPFYSAELVSIPWGNAPTIRAMQPVIEQLISFPMGVTNDLVMAHWFADLGVRDILRRAHMPMFNERMKVPARIRRGRRVVDFNTRDVRKVPEHEQRRSTVMGVGAMNYRRQLVGRPTRHSEVVEPEPADNPQFVNVAGSPFDPRD